LDGLHGIKRDGKEFTMVFVGKGEDQEDMEAYAEELGIGGNCRFVGPVYNREELRAYYTMADLFLFPSSYDTFGLVVREAAACATASLLVRDSCAAEGVTDDVNCFLVEETGRSIYECLSRVGHDRQLLAKVGQNAQDMLYVSWEDSIEHARQRYQVVLERYHSGKTGRKFEWSDEFFNTMDELCEKVTWVRHQRDKVLDRGRDIKELVMGKFDRYF